VYSHREHKVHNIVLYPEKHSWCTTTPIKQVVGHPGCETVEVDNNVCVGACFSYSIPRTHPTAPGEVAPYCDSCQPSKVTWKQVNLVCKSGEGDGTGNNEVMSKKVEIIANCSCLTCRHDPQEKNSMEVTTVDPATSEDVPQLLNLMYNSQAKLANSSGSHTERKHDIPDEKLSLLLKLWSGVEEDPESADGEALQVLLSHIRTKDPDTNHNALEDLAHKMSEPGHVQLDMEKLKHYLDKIEKVHAHSEEHSKEHVGPHRHQHGTHFGPHHSKVFDSEEGEKDEEFAPPTLDVPAHHIKPAHEGTHITYHSHPPRAHSHREPLDEE